MIHPQQRATPVIALLLFALTGLWGCSPGPPGIDSLIYADEMVSYSAGDGAGYGQNHLPDVVLGAPQGAGPMAGSLDVLSLGAGGEIVLAFSSTSIIDGPGDDFIIFENAFQLAGSAEDTWVELAEVSVSADGVEWHTYPCQGTADEQGSWSGCAGWNPVLPIDASTSLDALGGDRFDLADLGLTEVRFIRIRDLSTQSAEPTAGFDLDAIAAIHHP